MRRPEILVGTASGVEHRLMPLARQQLSDFSDRTLYRSVRPPLALASDWQAFRLVEVSLPLAIVALLEVPKEDRPPMLK
jgi:hypothetical protein